MVLDEKKHYLLEELPRHLSASNQGERLEVLLKDLGFINQKIYHFFTTNLLADFNLLSGNSLILNSLQQTLQKFSHLFDRCEEQNELSNTLVTRLASIKGMSENIKTFQAKMPRPYILPFREYPDTPNPSELQTLNHNSEIRSMVFGPNSRQLITCGKDYHVRVWELESGGESLTLASHEGNLTKLRLSSDFQTLISSSEDQTLTVWDFVKDKIHLKLKGHKDIINDCALASDNSFILSVSEDLTAKCWSLDDGQLLMTISDFSSPPTACTILHPPTLFSVGLENGQLLIYRIGKTSPLHAYQAHADKITRCLVDPSGNWLITASTDHTLRVWDIESWDLVAQLSHHTKPVTDAIFSPEGHLLITVSEDEVILLWETNNWGIFAGLTGHSAPYNGGLLSCAISPDGKKIASGSVFDSIKIWQVPESPTPDYSQIIAVYDCSFDQKGLKLAVREQNLDIWDASCWEKLLSIPAEKDPGGIFDLSPSGDFIVLGTPDGRVIFLSLPEAREITTFQAHTDLIGGLTISTSGKYLVTASDDKTVKLWDTKTHQLIHSMGNFKTEAWICCISPDDQLIVTANLDDPIIYIWNLHNGKQFKILAEHLASVASCRFDISGKKMISASHDGTAIVWNTNNWSVSVQLEGHLAWVNDASFSPDGKYAATVSQDETIRIWNISTAKSIAILRLDGWLESVSWHPNGSHLIATGQKGIYFLEVVW